MANNMLWLVHVPTGKAFCLGKRMASGWYIKGDIKATTLNAFYDDCFNDCQDSYMEQDDFALVIEDANIAPNCVELDRYTRNKDNSHHPVVDKSKFNSIA